MYKNWHWCCFAVYMALFGAFCGLEVDTFVEDLPFFQVSTFLLLFDVLFVLLIPLFLYVLFVSVHSLWRNRAARTGMFFLNSVYFHFVVLLLLYKAARDIDFDFYFFWYNLSVVLSVLWKLYAPWMILIVISVVAFTLFQNLAFSPVARIAGKTPRKVRLFFATLIVSSMICQLLTMGSIRGSTAGFLYASFVSDHHLRAVYHDFYQSHITALRSSAPTFTGRENPSRMGDVIFFIQQESLSDYLVDPRITPQLLRASQDGILLRKLYGNSIQSLRGYECILCGVPPSADRALVDAYAPQDLEEIQCLPRIFKALGYLPLLFYSGNPNPRVTRFFEYIGFEKILADDIVQKGDVRYDWGYREDTFFTRVHEYLQKHYPHEKLFVFITASATNHTPFEVQDPKLLEKIPFKKARKFEQRLSNTTYAQDAYLGHFYDIFEKYYADRGSLVAVSDHSWPIPIHKNNMFNERGAYEENFLITMLFVPPLSRRQDFAVGTTVPYRFSQMDIVPTVLDLIGLKQDYLLGESFAPWLLASRQIKRTRPQKLKISVQPYGGGFISAVQYPNKYLFDVLGNSVKTFDLEKDPAERSPFTHNTEDFTFLIKEFFENTPRD